MEAHQFPVRVGAAGPCRKIPRHNLFEYSRVQEIGRSGS